MKLGSLSIYRKEALDIILHNLYERLLEKPIIKNAFLITEETVFEQGEEKTHFKITDIPIHEDIYVPQKNDTITFHNNKFSFKERIKILLKR